MNLSRLSTYSETVRGRTVIGSSILAFVVVGYLLLLYSVPQLLLAPKGQTVKAQFTDTALLRPGNDVRVHGIRVGRVQSVDLDPGARSATVEMRVYKEGQPLFANARAAIRWRTLLGGSFYVDLDRGSPDAGQLSGRFIPKSRTLTQVELEDVARIDRGATKDGLRTTLRETPRAFKSPRAASDAAKALADGAPSIGRGLNALRGQQAGDLRRLESGIGRTARALTAPSDGFRRFIAGSATTFGATAGQSAAIAQAIQRAATVQRPVRTTLASLDSTLDQADPLLNKLREAAPRLEPAVRHLRPTLVDADVLLRDVVPLMRALRPAARDLKTAGRRGAPVLDRLAEPLRRLDSDVLPEFAKRSPESQRATYEMIGSTFASLSGGLSRFDAESSFAVLYANISDRSIDTAPCRSYVADPTDPKLADCKALAELLPKIFKSKAGR